MKKYKLSPWHDENTHPVRVGIYEIRRHGKCMFNGDLTMFSYFDGKTWRDWISPSDFKNGKCPSEYKFPIFGQDRKWRGILKD